MKQFGEKGSSLFISFISIAATVERAETSLVVLFHCLVKIIKLLPILLNPQ